MERADSKFHDQVRKDFRKGFLNTQEFGGLCKFIMRGRQLFSYDDEGNQLPGLKLVEDAIAGVEDLYANGIDTERKRLVIQDIDIDPPPEAYEDLLIDDKYWTVVTVNQPLGQCILTLERRKS